MPWYSRSLEPYRPTLLCEPDTVMVPTSLHATVVQDMMITVDLVCIRRVFGNVLTVYGRKGWKGYVVKWYSASTRADNDRWVGV
jgi:hypothetical protein